MKTLQLGPLCAALGVKPRYARYLLEQGFIPPGVAEAPNHGTHRQFGPRQAMWLAIAVMVKEAGLPARRAAEVAEYCTASLKTVSKQLGWEHAFDPQLARWKTDRQYVAEIADGKLIRLGTDARPGMAPGEMHYFDWHRLGKPRRAVPDPRACTLLRINLHEIARRLASAFQPWEEEHARGEHP